MKKAKYFIQVSDKGYLKSIENGIELTPNIIGALQVEFEEAHRLIALIENKLCHICMEEPVEESYYLVNESKEYFKELNRLNKPVFTSDRDIASKIDYEDLESLIELLLLKGNKIFII